MPYAEPQTVDSIESCFFYHSMELPTLGLVEGAWDLRGVIDDYLGGVDVQGKRVLDIGAASGYLTFELERLGAQVVSFDIAEDGLFDCVPHAGGDLVALQEKMRGYADAIKRAYWLAHRLHGSSAQVVHGDVYDLPASIGAIDVAVFGMILGHLRDPFAALAAAARLEPQMIVVTNQTSPDDRGSGPYAHWMPSRENGETNAWWGLSVGCLKQMLEVLGYDVIDVRSLWPTCRVEGRTGREHCSSLVATRATPPR